MKYFTSQKDRVNAKKYWVLAKDHHALLNPMDSHHTITLIAENDLGFAYDMLTYLCENHTIPPRETFDILVDKHTKEKLQLQARHLERLHSRCYN